MNPSMVDTVLTRPLDTPARIPPRVKIHTLARPNKLNVRRRGDRHVNAERVIFEQEWQFLLAFVTLSLGLGTLWRLPYLCYKNGGLAFLVPYALFLCCVSGPLLALQIGLGQFMGQGSLAAWKIIPIFKGLGFSGAFLSFLYNIPHTAMIPWCFHYASRSLNPMSVPWSCQHGSNQGLCTCRANRNSSSSSADACVEKGPAQHYWEHHLPSTFSPLNSTSILNFSQLELSLLLTFSWLVIFLFVIKGLSPFGRLAHLPGSLLPPLLGLMLVVALLYGDGAWEGGVKVIMFGMGELGRLNEPQVWLDAGTESLLSLGLPFCGLISLASKNSFKRNFASAALACTSLHFLLALLSCACVFAGMGIVEKQSGTIRDPGPELSLLMFSHLLTLLPKPQFCGFLFFALMAMVMIATSLFYFGVVISALAELPVCCLKRSRPAVLIALLCILSLVLGLPCTSEAGFAFFQHLTFLHPPAPTSQVDPQDLTGALSYSQTSLLPSSITLLPCLFQLVALTWLYGPLKWNSDVKQMLGRGEGCWLEFCWVLFTPTVLAGLFLISLMYGSSHFSALASLASHEPVDFSAWVGLAWNLGAGVLGLMPVPGYFMWAMCRAKGSNIRERYFSAKHPDLREALRLRQREQQQRAELLLLNMGIEVVKGDNTFI